MIIIADCGGTKGDWAIADGGVCLRRVRTGGINPFHQQPADIRHQLEVLCSSCCDLFSVADVLEVYFYGAGCNAVGSEVMERLLAEALSGYGATLHLHVASDLLGAARALCGGAEGIACILGTGSNSCLYDGTRIVDNTPPLGYILGDEGSGADLGKHFLHGVLKGLFPAPLRDAFYEAYHTSYGQLIQQIYQQPQANRYLATIAPFVHRHVGQQCVADMVVTEFRRFFSDNIRRYQRPDLPVGFVGGIAHAFEPQLRQAAQAEGFQVGTILSAPMPGLLAGLNIQEPSA